MIEEVAARVLSLCECTDLYGESPRSGIGACTRDVCGPGLAPGPGARPRARRFARLPCRSVRNPADPARPPRHSPRFVLYTVSATHENGCIDNLSGSVDCDDFRELNEAPWNRERPG